jgi:hypothetical protein
MKSHRILAGVLTVVAVATLAACGGDDDKADLGPYIDALAADFAKTDDNEPPVSEEQARCVAESSVKAIDEDVITAYETPEALVEATEEDLTALDLDDETLDEVAEGIVECLGGIDFMLDALAGFGLTDEQVSCVGDTIDEADFVASIRADLAAEEDAAFGEKIEACAGG